MNNEQIKFIAEGLGFDIEERGKVVFVSINWSDFIPFDPFKNWNDCGLVLEALVRESAKDKNKNVCLADWSIIGEGFGVYLDKSEEFSGDLKHAICQAFLALKGWEGER